MYTLFLVDKFFRTNNDENLFNKIYKIKVTGTLFTNSKIKILICNI